MTKIIETIILVSCSFGTGIMVAAHLVRRQINGIQYTETTVYAQMRVTNESLVIVGSLSYGVTIVASGFKLLAMDSFWVIPGAIVMMVAGITLLTSIRLAIESRRLWRRLHTIPDSSVESDSS